MMNSETLIYIWLLACTQHFCSSICVHGELSHRTSWVYLGQNNLIGISFIISWNMDSETSGWQMLGNTGTSLYRWSCAQASSDNLLVQSPPASVFKMALGKTLRIPGRRPAPPHPAAPVIWRLNTQATATSYLVLCCKETTLEYQLLIYSRQE